MKTLIWSFILFTISLVVTAQTTPCPVHYQRAITQAESACDSINRNQACYGNNTVNLTPFSDETEVNFSMPGDLADVEVIRVLSLSALNTESGEWGITMMRLLANVNPTNADDVTLLLFGDVEMESASEQTITQQIITNTVANVRQYPNTTATVVASFPESTSLNAIGRTEDGTWIQVHDSTSNLSGWIHSDLLTVDDPDSLQIVESTQSYYGPMQAFYFRGGSAAGQLDCNAIPSDGLLIQTPEGVGRVTLWINEVTIDFLSSSGSTALVSPQVDDTMTIEMLEGTASVQSDEGGYVAVAGSSITVETNGDGNEPPTVNPPQPVEIIANNGESTVVLGREIDTAPANTETIASANGLTPTQYDEVVEYGVVITASEPENTSGNSSNGQTQTQTTSTDTGTNSQNTASNSDSGNASANTQNGTGNNDNCPGNSCNAPGQNNNNDNCPGNSCNAPGQNNGNNGNGNNGNGNGNGGGNGNGNNGNGNGNGGGNGNGNNGNGNGNGN